MRADSGSDAIGWDRPASRWWVVALLAVAFGSQPGAAIAARAPTVTITVLSNRADLVSGGQALVAVDMSHGSDPSKLRVTLNRRDVSSEFAVRPNGRYEGLVTGLNVGNNVLEAALKDGHGAQITITDHPIGGPVFAGPQIQPWKCQTGALDKQCDEPPKFRAAARRLLESFS
jgi:hypothetical protein